MNEEKMRVLAVDDDRTFLEDLARLMDERFELERAYTAREALEAVGRSAFDALLLDIDLGRGTDGFEVLDQLRRSEPDLPVIMVTRDSSSSSAVAALKKGAVDYLDKRPDLEDLERRISRAVGEQRLRRRHRRLQLEVDSKWTQMVGESAPMRDLRESMRQAAGGASPALVVGQTGTGKELVARGIHRLGGRPGLFRAVNCASIPQSLFESELFGSERGAWTGAERPIIGAFEDAAEGTLFLDEITEMEPALQAKLLRVVEDREFRRLGGGPSRRFRGRLLASTNRDPRTSVAEGRLRPDLYYRLNTFVVRAPALAERTEDIPLLVDYFLDLKSAELGRPRREVPPDQLARLCAHQWPGNVRELLGAVERYLTGGELLPAAHTADGPSPPAGSGSGWDPALLDLPYKEAKEAVVQAFQRKYVRAVLDAHGGDAAAAAAAMGLSTFGLQKILQAIE